MPTDYRSGYRNYTSNERSRMSGAGYEGMGPETGAEKVEGVMKDIRKEQRLNPSFPLRKQGPVDREMVPGEQVIDPTWGARSHRTVRGI